METRKKFAIKIQSLSDLITNSSSEVYRIKSNVETWMFREMWDGILKNWGYSEEEIRDDSTISGDIRREGDYIILDYSIMCNLDYSAEEKLNEIFGKENVKDITWENW